MDNETLKRKTWEEFRDTGLLWWVNRSLHLFGWAICIDGTFDENGKVVVHEVYPARCKFRGFNTKSEEKGFCKLTNYLSTTIPELVDEIKEQNEKINV